MPRNNELNKILLIGSGPIVIGQGCEFDYSGVQACKALREERYQVVLVNSNPATIMTYPEFADRTYIEPITAEVIEAIMEREKPDAILPTMGGQTALNAAMELNRNGALARHNVKLIGANAQAIAKGEDRQLFKEAMLRIGLDVPRSGIAHSAEDADKIADAIGSFPLIIRPAFTLGGSGGGIAYNREELAEIAGRGLAISPVNAVLIEQSLVGWKEFEMEVMRDRADNCVVVCSIENFDPMGIHTGDSITVAPVQTLTDKEFQMMRDAAFAVIREIGVETGGSNIQFAVNPENGRMVVIEMNPRVSRSSALASKATGFPIAKIAAKLAVGYTLDEIFELTKIGRWFLGNVKQIVEEDSRLRLSRQTAVTAVDRTEDRGAGFQPVGTTGVPPVATSEFRPVDPRAPVIQTRRRLPHWEQQGATYFITFRLADAVPQKLLRQWKEELETWRKFHPEPWDASTKYEYQKRFRDAREEWLDQGHGGCILRHSQIAATVANSLRHFDGVRYALDSFVVMPNHVHVLVQPHEDNALSEILHSWKSFSAKAINKFRERSGIVWQDENYDRMVRDFEELERYRDYIKENPVAAKLDEGEFILELWEDAAGETPARPADRMSAPLLLRAKKLGFSDRQLAIAGGVPEKAIRSQRIAQNITPTYRLVDTCAAEFEAYTPYYYSTYGNENERRESGKRKIMILGGGPNRIGQGIEFDYYCVHAAFALRELVFETIMVNANPETV